MLLVHSPTDEHARYSRYLAEILRMEGFADFEEAELPSLGAPELARYDLVVLPRLTTTVAQADALEAYVGGGGRLIVFFPDDQLARRLGMVPAHLAAGSGYLRPCSDPTVAGLPAEPVQVLTPSLGWTPHPEAGARVLAELLYARDGASIRSLPAVVRSSVGRGEAVLFSYDLPHAVARLRQGNPDHADVCFGSADGIYRGPDLVVGDLDRDLRLVPQADVHTALLARVVESLAPGPRVWYYPEAEERSVVVMTSDDDWSSLEQFEALLEGLERRGGTCTFYMVPGTHISLNQMREWERRGHTFSVHPALEADYSTDSRPAELQRLFVPRMIRENVARHERALGTPVRTIRNHCVRWVGYTEMARVEAELGVGMDCNWVTVYPVGLGYSSGSGRPLRFVDPDGAVIPCFQQPAMWTEECLINPHHRGALRWSTQRGIEETTALIRRTVREFYTPITFNSHPVSFATYSRPMVEANWDAAREEGVRIVSADRWLEWTEARDALRLSRDEGSWTLRSPRATGAVTLLFPPGTAPRAEGGTTSRQTLWGSEYEALTLRDVSAGESRRIELAKAASRA